MSAPQARHVCVKPVDVRQAAAQHDDIRIEDVDDLRQRARQAGFVALQRGFAVGIPGKRLLRDFMR